MPLEVDYRHENPEPEGTYDPFMAKYELVLNRKKTSFEHFQHFLGYDLAQARDTTMIYLVLKNGIEFTELEMMKIIGLKPDVIIDYAIFTKFQQLVGYVAKILRERVPVESLMKMPLTDISRICYGIAWKFESLFFVPVKGTEHLLDFWFADRFNGMWPIICEVNKAYKRKVL